MEKIYDRMSVVNRARQGEDERNMGEVKGNKGNDIYYLPS